MWVEHLECVPTPAPRLVAFVLTFFDAPVVQHGDNPRACKRDVLR
jgi:hypothetical protein